MNTKINFENYRKFTACLVLAGMFAWTMMLTILVEQAQAIVTTTITDATPLFGGLKLKQASNSTAVLKIQFGSDSNTETLTSIKVTFTATAGSPTWNIEPTTSSELSDLAGTNGGVQLWKDVGAAGFQGAGTDTQVTLTGTPTYASGTTLILNPNVDPSISTDDVYFVVLKTNPSATNNNAFTVGIAADGDKSVIV